MALNGGVVGRGRGYGGGGRGRGHGYGGGGRGYVAGGRGVGHGNGGGRGRGSGGRGDGGVRGGRGGGRGDGGVRGRRRRLNPGERRRLRKQSERALANFEESKVIGNRAHYSRDLNVLMELPMIFVTLADQVKLVGYVMREEGYGGKLAIPENLPALVKEGLKNVAADEEFIPPAKIIIIS